jgi:hypothetical protein
MLCDNIVADTILHGLYDDLDKTVQKIKDAQKFVLAPEFCMAADGLVENIEELNKIVPMCRTPYPLTWIEFLHDDRPHWNPAGPYGARPVDPTRHQASPQRVGFLLEQISEDAKKWQAHLFWKLRSIPVGAIDSTLHNASIMKVEFDCDASLNQKEPMYTATKPRLAQFGAGLVGTLSAKMPDVGKRLMEYAAEDWGGEVRFLVAVLGLLNARNVVQVQKIDRELENKKRQKHGKRPLFSHTLLKVRPFIVQHERIEKGGRHNYRLHFVRGHFKHRRTGLFWWSTHARGDAKVGMVEKDYEVEGK